MRVKDVLLPDGWHYDKAIILILAVCCLFLFEGGRREGGRETIKLYTRHSITVVQHGSKYCSSTLLSKYSSSKLQYFRLHIRYQQV